MKHLVWMLILPLIWTVPACKKGAAGAKEFDLGAELGKLQAAQTQLADMRQQVADLQAKVKLLKDAKKHPRKYKKEDLPEGDLAGLQAQLDQAAKAAEDEAKTLMDNLVAFLNKGLNDYPDTPETKSAVRMYSDENIMVAQGHIDGGGKYKKAIDIYKVALQYDPDYDLLLEKLQQAQDFLIITKERFDSVKKGMTMDEVKKTCGVPNLNKIKEYKQKGKSVIAWYYPREDASHAAVYFHRGKVYNKDWSAIKKQ